jgi:hypothetical protein
MANGNKFSVLISGPSATGKSASLAEIRNQSDWMYLNCETGKELPFQSKFREFTIIEPAQVTEGLEYALATQDDPDGCKGVIIDTLTFLMDMKESQDIYQSSNTQTAWADFAQFFKKMMQEKVAALHIPVVFLAHTFTNFTDDGRPETFVPIKGSIKNNGVESYFSLVVSTKRMSLKELEANPDYDKDLLHITEDDRINGFKYVFQTRLTPKTLGERIRAPMKMFNVNQTYMDNDVQLLMDHVSKYYNS